MTISASVSRTVRVVLMPAARQILDFSSLSDGCLTSLVVVCLVTPTGGGEKGSPPPKSSGFVNDGCGYFGGRGIAHLPSSSHSRDGLLPRLQGLRRRKDWHLPPLHNAGEYFGGGGTGPPPHNVREYLGGGRTGLPPRTVGVYFMHMVGNNDELNILYSQTYRAVTVEGDRAVFLRLCRS